MKIPEGDLKPGESRLLTMDGKEVALFNVEGHFYAVGNRCPHRSGPLVRGHIERVSSTPPHPTLSPSGGEEKGEGASAEETLAVRCPIHGWLFDLATGRCLNRPSASTPIYPVTCEDGQLCIGQPQGEFSGPSAPIPV